MVDISKFTPSREICIGVTSAASLEDVACYNEYTPFVSSVAERRTNPKLIMKDCEQIIAVAVKSKPGEIISGGAAELSSLGTDYDYHKEVREVLYELAEFITNAGIKIKKKILVDSPDLDERAFAMRANLGQIGKNNLLINNEFGTRFNLGLMLVDKIVIKLDTVFSDKLCKECLSCVKICPTGALNEKKYDVNRCISFLTQKKDLKTHEEILIGNQLYGCDICQKVCPINKEIINSTINPTDIITATDDELKKRFSHTAMLWQGTELIRRNANIILRGAI